MTCTTKNEVIKELRDTVGLTPGKELQAVSAILDIIAKVEVPSVVPTTLKKDKAIADILYKLYPDIKLEYVSGTKEAENKSNSNDAGIALLDSLLQSQDILPKEYVRHYVSGFADAPIVKEAIRKWGSEEVLVQAITEQVIAQKGEAYGWWKTFSKWVKTMFNGFDSLEKEAIKNVITDAFLSRYNLSAIATRKHSNYELNELFLDSVKNRYNEHGVDATLDEFIDYADSIFPKSQLQDIYKHDTNIIYSSASPNYNTFMQTIYTADQSIKDQAKEVFNKYKEEISTVLRDYRLLKKNRRNIKKVPLTLSNSKGLIVTGAGRGFNDNGKKIIMEQLDAYATVPGAIIYIDTNDMSEHTLDISDLGDTKKPYAERKQIQTELAKTLEGSNIIIQQIEKGGMGSTTTTYYVADAANKFIQARKKIAENLSKNGFEEASNESNHYVHEFEFLPIIDALMLNKGVSFVLRQDDIVEYVLENLESNIFMHKIMKGFKSIEGASSLSKTIGGALEHLVSSEGQSILDSQNKKKQWMYNEGFQERYKGKNFNVRDAAYYFGEVGQAAWGSGNTTFLTKLNVTAEEKGYIGAIPNISDTFRAQNDKSPVEVVVENVQQIHIFGSNKDIEMFKEWKSKQARSKPKEGIISENKLIAEMTPSELIEAALKCAKG